MLKLRDALYSSEFRDYLSTVTGAGPLSGKKTDMAINVYTPGCHLLCHDDVIGSRRVSYILYLTDPDRPWKEEWGGALRLYPTQTFTEKDGQIFKVPSPDFSFSIPPAFNQLSFFSVQPGESFHDVEEVFARTDKDKEQDDGGRIRMAISGWYHIPQKGENGFEEGLEEKVAKKSSLMQLQGKADAHDLPQPQTRYYDSSSTKETRAKEAASDPDADILTETDLDFLLPYLTPSYLTPDIISDLSAQFEENSVLRLDSFLNHKFATVLQTYIESQEASSLPLSSEAIDSSTPWTVARPPHKHRYLFIQPEKAPSASSSQSTATITASEPDSQTPLSPIHDLLQNLLPSAPFRKWLQLATSLTIDSHSLLARRFRRGKDYTLATNYTEEASRLELTLGITPKKSRVGDNKVDLGEGSKKDVEEKPTAENKAEVKDHSTGDQQRGGQDPEDDPDDDVEEGGYEVYMAGDDPEVSDNDSEASSFHGIPLPTSLTSTGARASGPSAPSKARPPKESKSDPAIYHSIGADKDDGILFSMPMGWNRLSIVLRDKGVLKFVKYLGKGAKGDRWDLVGGFGVREDEDEGEEEEEDYEVEGRGGDGDGDGDGKEGQGNGCWEEKETTEEEEMESVESSE